MSSTEHDGDYADDFEGEGAVEEEVLEAKLTDAEELNRQLKTIMQGMERGMDLSQVDPALLAHLMQSVGVATPAAGAAAAPPPAARGPAVQRVHRSAPAGVPAPKARSVMRPKPSVAPSAAAARPKRSNYTFSDDRLTDIQRGNIALLDRMQRIAVKGTETAPGRSKPAVKVESSAAINRRKRDSEIARQNAVRAASAACAPHSTVLTRTSPPRAHACLHARRPSRSASCP